MEYIEKSNLFFVYDAKAEVQKRICSGQFTIVDDDFATLGFKCGVDYVMDIIKKAEVKDVAPVIHSRWIAVYNPNFSPFDNSCEFIYLCKNCGNGNGISKDFNYCPVCGAKMDEE